MIAVLFEVVPRDGRQQDYLDLAAKLGTDLEGFDGFISIERFSSLSQPGRILSLSYWRDEAAVRAWRCRPQHRSVQEQGRDGIFEDYRLRVASVIRDYTLRDRTEAPADSRAAHG